MIDTDKYEGHTPASWYFDEDMVLRKTWTREDDKAVQNKEHDVWEHDVLRVKEWCGNDADRQLIADAPLLLAEVLRLREVIRELTRDITAEEAGEGE